MREERTPVSTVDGKGEEMPAYTIRRFPSATGHTFFQVMNPFGQRVYESTEYNEAQARADRLNDAHEDKADPSRGDLQDLDWK